MMAEIAAGALRQDDDRQRDAARLMRSHVEEALYGFRDIMLDFDRAAVGARLQRAITCAYAVMDSPAGTQLRRDGLTEAEALVSEARQLLLQLTPADDQAMHPVSERLALALSALRLSREACSHHLSTQLGDIPGHNTPQLRRNAPFRASAGIPQLQMFERKSLSPAITLEPRVPPPAPAEPPPQLPAPATLDELRRFAAKATSGELASDLQALLDEEPATEPIAAAEPMYDYLPALQEREWLRVLARNLLEDIAIGRALRLPNASEGWLDQLPFEQALCNNLDALFAYGEPVLSLLSLYHAEADSADPGRAFAVSLVLGSIAGSDTVRAAVAVMRDSQPESFPGWVEGFHLAPNPAIDEAMHELLASPRDDLALLATDVLMRRGRLSGAKLGPLLQRDGPAALQQRCAYALRDCLPEADAVAALQMMLDGSDNDEVRYAAAESLLLRNVRLGLSWLRASLLGELSESLGGSLTWLLGVAGNESDVELLLERAGCHRGILSARALGRFGHLAAVPLLIDMLRDGDEEVALAAGEALERITGAGLLEQVELPWDFDIPPEVEEYLVVPIPKRSVLRPVTDVSTWADWTKTQLPRWSPRTRYRGGRPLALMHIVDELAAAQTPVARRQDAALELRIRSSIQPTFCTDDWVLQQRSELAELRRRVAALAFTPGSWARASEQAPGISGHDAGPAILQTMAGVLFDANAALPFTGKGGLPPIAISESFVRDDRSADGEQDSTLTTLKGIELSSEQYASLMKGANPFDLQDETKAAVTLQSTSDGGELMQAEPANVTQSKDSTASVKAEPDLGSRSLDGTVAGMLSPAQLAAMIAGANPFAQPPQAGAHEGTLSASLPPATPFDASPSSSQVVPPSVRQPPASVDARYRAEQLSVAQLRQSTGAAPRREPALSLEMFAWLQCQEVLGNDVFASALAQRGLNAEHWEQWRRYWWALIESNTDLKERWQRLLAYYSRR